MAKNMSEIIQNISDIFSIISLVFSISCGNFFTMKKIIFSFHGTPFFKNGKRMFLSHTRIKTSFIHYPVQSRTNAAGGTHSLSTATPLLLSP